MTAATWPKVPARPPHPLSIDWNEHLRVFDAPLWRVYSTTGQHPQTWNTLRNFGPVNGMRFDPHPPPPRVHTSTGVLYTAARPSTALGEVFYSTHVIDRGTNGRAIVSWQPTRPLRLLDLTSQWPVLNGTSAALMMTDAKENTRVWAHAIDAQFGHDIDGLYHQSSITNEPLITLFWGARDAFPARPGFHLVLASGGADALVESAARALGFGVLD